MFWGPVWSFLGVWGPVREDECCIFHHSAVQRGQVRVVGPYRIFSIHTGIQFIPGYGLKISVRTPSGIVYLGHLYAGESG